MKEELVIESCVLSADTTQELMRKQLARKLENNDEFVIGGKNGNVMDQDSPTGLIVESGRLAYQWYELHPELWASEKEAMRQFWPDFKWGKWQDGRLYWEGYIQPGVYGNGRQKYYVIAIYNEDFPTAVMGGAMHVIPIKPSINEIEQFLGARLHHVLSSNADGRYLCTTTREDMHGLSERMYTTAAQTLGWATKWFTALELVMSGNMSLATFNNPVGI